MSASTINMKARIPLDSSAYWRIAHGGECAGLACSSEGRRLGEKGEKGQYKGLGSSVE